MVIVRVRVRVGGRGERLMGDPTHNQGGRDAMWERNIAKRRQQLAKAERRLGRLQATIEDASRRELGTVTVEGGVMTLAQARLQLAARSESVDTLRT